MASNLTVNLGGGKKQLIKTTPNMILRQVVTMVCEKQGYPDAENYGLKNGKATLDLSLSIRYANIAAGAKLELVKVPKSKTAATHVDIALQLEEGGRMVQSFAIVTSLWDVLLGFEKASNGTLNLTRRTAAPQPSSKNIFSLQRIAKAIKTPSQVYLLPVVVLLEREYVSIEKLKLTTLQLAGLFSGNAVLRVLMRYTDAGIEDFMAEIERPAAVPHTITPATGATPLAATSSTVPTVSSLAVAPAQTTASTATSSAPSASSSTSSSTTDKQPQPAVATREINQDKSKGFEDRKTVGEAYHPQQQAGPSSPMGSRSHHSSMSELPGGMTSRGGSVSNNSREGPVVGPSPQASMDMEVDLNMNVQRPSPAQDLNTSMIEATHEIRQLREQQAQASLTDRVKRLSKSSENSDRERFVRSIAAPEFTDEPLSEMDDEGADNYIQRPDVGYNHYQRHQQVPVQQHGAFEAGMEIDGHRQQQEQQQQPARQPSPQQADKSSIQPATAASNLSQEEVIRQIAHRVSLQFKQSQQQGGPALDYKALIAQEIVKEQKAGVLPASPAESRSGSMRVNNKSDSVSSGSSLTTGSVLNSATFEPPSLSSGTTPQQPQQPPVNRDVKVFKAPEDSSIPLSNKIELPDDFYNLTSQDMVKLIASQKKQREAEENRGFKTSQVRAEEERLRQEKYPKTVIRIRFPDRVQLQATFSSQETIGDLKRWVQDATVGQGEKFDLYITPPKKVLSDNKQTLYQAGLAPQSVVYFSWADSKLNLQGPFLNGQHQLLLEDLPIPSMTGEPVAGIDADKKRGGHTLTGSSSSTLSSTPAETKRANGQGGSLGGSGGGVPKWMKLGKK